MISMHREGGSEVIDTIDCSTRSSMRLHNAFVYSLFQDGRRQESLTAFELSVASISEAKKSLKATDGSACPSTPVVYVSRATSRKVHSIDSPFQLQIDSIAPAISGLSESAKLISCGPSIVFRHVEVGLIDAFSNIFLYPRTQLKSRYIEVANSSVPYASASNMLVSPRGLFRVHGYHNLESEAGMPIKVALHFCHSSAQTTYLRLVLGRKALTTTVRPLKNSKQGTWELESIAPTNTHMNVPFPLSVQALNSENGVLDSLVVGNFSYCSVPAQLPYPIVRSNSLKNEDGSDADSDIPLSEVPKSRRRPTRSSTRSRSGKDMQSVFPRKKQAIMRTRRFAPGEDLPESHRIILELVTPLESMANDWTEQEIEAGRRLIRFFGRQEGLRLKVSCERINQEDYREGEAVVSCIYRKDTSSCCVTSVDIICLLESLVGDGFEIEEKNRIRRNLEGFRPKTVSKNRVGSESLFQQIMDFPAPKPRNIEKDVKVFDWSVLPQALDKIISKYSLYSYSSDTVNPFSFGEHSLYAPSVNRTGSFPVVPSSQPSSSMSERRSYSLQSTNCYLDSRLGHEVYPADLPSVPLRSDSHSPSSTFMDSSSNASPMFSRTSSPLSQSSFNDSPASLNCELQPNFYYQDPVFSQCSELSDTTACGAPPPESYGSSYPPPQRLSENLVSNLYA
ncbi:hypothetical protein ABKN59_002077 [Abortiporus biennis]